MPITTPSAELRRQSSGEQVALYVRKQIFEGELRPGMRVPQDAVARALGVSRIPVREALIALEREGWVTNELHRGAFVTALDTDAVRDHYELYGLTYGLAARRATERYGPTLAKELRPIVRTLADTTEPRRVTRLTVDFHARVVDAAQSPRMKVVLRGMGGMLPGDFFELVPEAIPAQRRGTGAITRAIGRSDAGAASDEYGRLLRRLGELVVTMLADRGLFTAPADEAADEVTEAPARTTAAARGTGLSTRSKRGERNRS